MGGQEFLKNPNKGDVPIRATRLAVQVSKDLALTSRPSHRLQAKVANHRRAKTRLLFDAHVVKDTATGIHTYKKGVLLSELR